MEPNSYIVLVLVVVIVIFIIFVAASFIYASRQPLTPLEQPTQQITYINTPETPAKTIKTLEAAYNYVVPKMMQTYFGDTIKEGSVETPCYIDFYQGEYDDNRAVYNALYNIQSPKEVEVNSTSSGTIIANAADAGKESLVETFDPVKIRAELNKKYYRAMPKVDNQRILNKVINTDYLQPTTLLMDEQNDFISGLYDTKRNAEKEFMAVLGQKNMYH